MKAKLIKHILVKADEGKYFLFKEDENEFRTQLVHKLSKQNCNEIFGVVYVEKLAHKFSDKFYNDAVPQRFASYIIGFNKAMELNKDKVFTLEDVESAMRCMISQEIFYGETHEETQQMRQTYIKSYIDFLTKEPTEIEVEIEMEEISSTYLVTIGEVKTTRLEPKLDSEGCLILKKI